MTKNGPRTLTGSRLATKSIPSFLTPTNQISLNIGWAHALVAWTCVWVVWTLVRVRTPVRAERLFVFGEHCSDTALQRPMNTMQYPYPIPPSNSDCMLLFQSKPLHIFLKMCRHAYKMQKLDPKPTKDINNRCLERLWTITLHYIFIGKPRFEFVLGSNSWGVVGSNKFPR